MDIEKTDIQVTNADFNYILVDENDEIQAGFSHADMAIKYSEFTGYKIKELIWNIN